MPWGDFLNTGTVTVKGRTEPVAAWRDTSAGAIPTALDRAGQNFVRSKVRDLTIVSSRPCTPPPCHTEAPSG